MRTGFCAKARGAKRVLARRDPTYRVKVRRDAKGGGFIRCLLPDDRDGAASLRAGLRTVKDRSDRQSYISDPFSSSQRRRRSSDRRKVSQGSLSSILGVNQT